MANQRQKNPKRLQGHRGNASSTAAAARALEGEVQDTPARTPARILRPAPKHWDDQQLRPEIIALWEAFWRSEVALAVDLAADEYLLHELFRSMNELAIVSEVIARSRLVQGSKGQPVRNPLITYRAQLEGEVERLSERFGMDPRSRFRLVGDAGGANDALRDQQEALERAGGASRVQEMPDFD